MSLKAWNWWQHSFPSDQKKKKKKWREAEARVVWKGKLNMGSEVEAMQTRWSGSGSEEGIVECMGQRRVYTIGASLSSERRMLQTRGNTGYNQEASERVCKYETQVMGSRKGNKGIRRGAGARAGLAEGYWSDRRERRSSE